MSKNIIQSVVIFLGILIVLAFLALIYGMYQKISISGKNLKNIPIIFSTKLKEGEKIKNIEVMDQNKLLIVIESNENIRGVLYNIQDNQIISLID